MIPSELLRSTEADMTYKIVTIKLYFPTFQMTSGLQISSTCPTSPVCLSHVCVVK